MSRLELEVRTERAYLYERCALCRRRFKAGERIVVLSSVHHFGTVRHAANHWRCPTRQWVRFGGSRAAA